MIYSFRLIKIICKCTSSVRNNHNNNNIMALKINFMQILHDSHKKYVPYIRDYKF